jgi:hypothetical protein
VKPLLHERTKKKIQVLNGSVRDELLKVKITNLLSPLVWKWYVVSWHEHNYSLHPCLHPCYAKAPEQSCKSYVANYSVVQIIAACYVLIMKQFCSRCLTCLIASGNNIS